MKTNKPQIFNYAQLQALQHAIEKGASDPSYLTSISGSGPVEELEVVFAKAVGGRYAVALSSCTAAIHTALMALGIGAGDEVIVIQKRECKAVGVAQMNANSMKQRTYGESVKIRHIHH